MLLLLSKWNPQVNLHLSSVVGTVTVWRWLLTVPKAMRFWCSRWLLGLELIYHIGSVPPQRPRLHRSQDNEQPGNSMIPLGQN